MNLWLDDIRRPPSEGIWWWAKTADEAIWFLENFRVEWVSLDHDLAYAHYHANPTSDFAEKTGYSVAYWMAEHDIWPSKGVTVHSANPVGAKRMMGLVDRYGPYHTPCRWEPRDLEGNSWPARVTCAMARGFAIIDERGESYLATDLQTS